MPQRIYLHAAMPGHPVLTTPSAPQVWVLSGVGVDMLGGSSWRGLRRISSSSRCLRDELTILKMMEHAI